MSYHSSLFSLEFFNAVYRPDVHVLHYNTVKYTVQYSSNSTIQYILL